MKREMNPRCGGAGAPWLARRSFLQGATALALAPGFSVFLASPAQAAQPGYGRLLVLVELKGGNDGLNTLVPFGDPAYARLRPRIALRREDLVHLSDGEGLHASLAPLAPLWTGGELAVLRSVGYPRPNLSHFRSIEIWDTASDSDDYLAEGWVARSFAARQVPPAYAADGLVIGNGGAGPMAGGTASRVLTLASTEQFLRQSRNLSPSQAGASRGNRALQHILKVEADIARAAGSLGSASAGAGAGGMAPGAGVPGNFGNGIKTLLDVVSGGAKVAAVRLTLDGFDTHQNQLAVQAGLLRQLGDGLVALRTGLSALGQWEDTLVLTYAEFGRRAAENGSGGTDHGTASVHFALGGRVRGGLYGMAPRLDQLQDGNLAHSLDFRSVYATVLQHWWAVEPAKVLGAGHAPLDFIRS